MLKNLAFQVLAIILFGSSALQARAADFSTTSFTLGISYDEVKSKLGPTYHVTNITVGNLPNARIIAAADPFSGKQYSFYFLQDKAIWIYFRQEWLPGKGPSAQSMEDSILDKYGHDTSFGVSMPADRFGAVYIYGPSDQLLLNGGPGNGPIITSCMVASTTTVTPPGTQQPVLFPTRFPDACNKEVRLNVYAVDGIVRVYSVEIENDAPVTAAIHAQADAEDRAKQGAARAAPKVKPGDL